MAKGMMSVGAKIWFRGGWGSDPPKEAIIEQIELCAQPHEKYGTEVDAVPWETKEYACVILSTGNWAYGIHCYQTREEALLHG